jgi:antitoxin component of RelBE/YafQ-DinJ toxin-antitoxin module
VSGFALGLMWGFAAGMAISGYLSYLEARAANEQRHPVEPRVVTDLDGAEVIRALRKHQRRTGRKLS